MSINYSKFKKFPLIILLLCSCVESGTYEKFSNDISVQLEIVGSIKERKIVELGDEITFSIVVRSSKEIVFEHHESTEEWLKFNVSRNLFNNIEKTSSVVKTILSESSGLEAVIFAKVKRSAEGLYLDFGENFGRINLIKEGTEVFASIVPSANHIKPYDSEEYGHSNPLTIIPNLNPGLTGLEKGQAH